MARSVLMLITVSDIGKISVDVRGPVSGKEGMLAILESARELVKQGNYGVGTQGGQRGNTSTEEPSHGYHEAGDI